MEPGGASLRADKTEIERMPRQDISLQKFRDMRDTTVSFEVKENILCRIFKYPRVTEGVPVRQVVVPLTLRRTVMELAHDSITDAHMGAKTTDKVLRNFYWLGVRDIVVRFCRS